MDKTAETQENTQLLISGTKLAIIIYNYRITKKINHSEFPLSEKYILRITTQIKILEVTANGQL